MTFIDFKDNVSVATIGQGFGGINDGSQKYFSSEADYIESLNIGIDNGLTFIDTAEAYADGYSEELIGKTVYDKRSEVQIATKFSPENNSFKKVIDAAERSLKRLKTDYIDLYQIHWPNPRIPIAETLSAMEVLIEQGKILNIGVSNFSELQLHDAMSSLTNSKIVSNQVEYNLFDRFNESHLFPFCKKNNIKIIAYSPLDKGRVTNSDVRLNLLENLATKYNKSKEQVALNWITTSHNLIAIPTSRNPSHIIQNSQSLDFKLLPEDANKIDTVCKLEPDFVEVSRIKVSLNGENSRQVYQTIEEAKANFLNLCPSPVELSESIKFGGPIKPVRLIASKDGEHDFELIEGRLRYWAWVLAFGESKAIPSYIRYN